MHALRESSDLTSPREPYGELRDIDGMDWERDRQRCSEIGPGGGGKVIGNSRQQKRSIIIPPAAYLKHHHRSACLKACVAAGSIMTTTI